MAEQHGVEMNFFLIPENKFRVGNRAQVGLDNCGSAQHLLLLKSFTAVLPVWRVNVCMAADLGGTGR
ncbi:hypothetical protein [uncultured Tolumonas sp.]|uniref:hypothetical protein n=1 Tax=uncultured Tolumonas sp. TaxID=263765 RepID=UPI002D1E4399|nr:hypothetical protein [uncultured Tolumonas sp.]